MEFFYYINLQKEVARNQYIINHFTEHDIFAYSRIEAFDANNLDLSKYIDKYNLDVGAKDLAVTMSHLLAIKTFVNDDHKYAIICEDDLDLSTKQFWPFSWQDFMRILPNNWDAIQLTTSSPNIVFDLHPRKPNDWGTVAYLINKSYGKFLTNKMFDGNNFNYAKFLEWRKPSKHSKAIAEGIIYQSPKCYSIPIFVYNTDFESSVHPAHVADIHIPAKAQIINYWQQYSTTGERRC